MTDFSVTEQNTVGFGGFVVFFGCFCFVWFFFRQPAWFCFL